MIDEQRVRETFLELVDDPSGEEHQMAVADIAGAMPLVAALLTIEP
jgi:hypothetical protein